MSAAPVARNSAVGETAASSLSSARSLSASCEDSDEFRMYKCMCVAFLPRDQARVGSCGPMAARSVSGSGASLGLFGLMFGRTVCNGPGERAVKPPPPGPRLARLRTSRTKKLPRGDGPRGDDGAAVRPPDRSRYAHGHRPNCPNPAGPRERKNPGSATAVRHPPPPSLGPAVLCCACPAANLTGFAFDSRLQFYERSPSWTRSTFWHQSSIYFLSFLFVCLHVCARVRREAEALALQGQATAAAVLLCQFGMVGSIFTAPFLMYILEAGLLYHRSKVEVRDIGVVVKKSSSTAHHRERGQRHLWMSRLAWCQDGV